MIKHTLRTTIKKVNGDCLTPILIFNRLHGNRKFLLESSAKQETTGRYSFIGVNPRKTYSGAGQSLTEMNHVTQKTYSYEGDLVHLMKQVMPRISSETDYPFTGGAVGYIRFNREHANIPAIHFQVYDTVIIFDHVTDELIIVHTNIDAEASEPNIDELIVQITEGTQQQQQTYTLGEFAEQTSDAHFHTQIKQAQAAIQHGEVTELVLARKQMANFDGQAFSLYRDFRLKNPSPYMYYIDFDDHIVMGASKESAISVYNHKLHTSMTQHTNSLLVNNTVVTNDGTVTGDLLPTLHAIDALTRLLPAKSTTGSPTEQAVTVIKQIEEDGRTLYGGAVGYIGFNGQIDFTLASNTLLIQNGRVMTEQATVITAENARLLTTEQG